MLIQEIYIYDYEFFLENIFGKELKDLYLGIVGIILKGFLGFLSFILILGRYKKEELLEESRIDLLD